MICALTHEKGDLHLLITIGDTENSGHPKVYIWIFIFCQFYLSYNLHIVKGTNIGEQFDDS